MQFRDQIVLRLMDATERESLLTNAVGQRILEAAYRFDTQEVGTVSRVLVRGWEAAPGLQERARFELEALTADLGQRWELRGVQHRAVEAAVDFHLDLAITATTRPVASFIEAVEISSLSQIADFDLVDARIVGEDGALPADAEDLDARRVTAMTDLLREELDEPDDFVAADFLSANRIGSAQAFADYIGRRGRASRLALDVAVVPTDQLQSVTYGVSLLVLIRDVSEPDVAAAVATIQRTRAQLAGDGGGGAGDSPPPRSSLPCLVIYPEAALDDAELPLPAGAPAGGPAEQRRAQRLTELNRRLQPLAIAVAMAS